MNKNIIFTLILATLLVVPMISAESISQTTIRITIYNDSIQIFSDEYSGNNQIINFSMSSDYNASTNITRYYIQYPQQFNYSFFFVKNFSVDMNLVDKYVSCLNETSSCKLDAASNFTQFSVSLANKDNDITNKQTQINTLTKQQADTQNQKWLFAVGGAAIALLITFAAQGKIGRKVKDKSAEEFNRNQAR